MALGREVGRPQFLLRGVQAADRVVNTSLTPRPGHEARLVGAGFAGVVVATAIWGGFATPGLVRAAALLVVRPSSSAHVSAVMGVART